MSSHRIDIAYKKIYRLLRVAKLSVNQILKYRIFFYTETTDHDSSIVQSMKIF